MFRTYEIDDAVLEEYGLPTGQQVLGRAETLDQMHEAMASQAPAELLNAFVAVPCQKAAY